MDPSQYQDDSGSEDEEVRNERLQLFLKDLISRAEKLLAELEIFRKRLRELRQEGSVELAHFRGVVQSELGMLEKLSARPTSQATSHIARSSNLPFMETVWRSAKRSRDLLALQKRIFHEASTNLSSNLRLVSLDNGGRQGKRKGDKQNATVVDAITENGRVWTKVSLVTNTRIIFDLAKQGWDSAGSDSDADFEPSPAMNADDDRDIPLLKTCKDLIKSSQQFRVRTRKPIVHLILPRVELGVTAEVDTVIKDCRAVGILVHCGKDNTPEHSLEDALQTMAPNPMTSFTDALNIDCTILLALVSDFSHAKISKESWFHQALQRQVEIEDNENLLPSLLYPAMADRELVCTEEAAKRMREIVDTIGTPSEKARTALLMGDEASWSAEKLREEMQEWSAYLVPSEWKLPIRAVDMNENGCQSSLPVEAAAVAPEMTSINHSVFMYGWASGRTTITSNRIVVKQIEKKLDAYDNLDDSIWPKIWLCPTARSLVGKEKRNAKKEVKDGAWPLPDPLRREHQRRNGLDVLSQREGHEVEDLRPNGYPSDEVIAAKLAARDNSVANVESCDKQENDTDSAI